MITRDRDLQLQASIAAKGLHDVEKAGIKKGTETVDHWSDCDEGWQHWNYDYNDPAALGGEAEEEWPQIGALKGGKGKGKGKGGGQKVKGKGGFSKGGFPKGGKGNKGEFLGECWGCGQKGHSQKYCPLKGKGKGKGEGKAGGMIAATGKGGALMQWMTRAPRINALGDDPSQWAINPDGTVGMKQDQQKVQSHEAWQTNPAGWYVGAVGSQQQVPSPANPGMTQSSGFQIPAISALSRKVMTIGSVTGPKQIISGP